ncbi:hypothetical protein GV64_10725 [Endozoicomonas elysicola]|uniref:Uncharacterized protein n=1 Tax=Endozoicomonas elysicola TaxID=305900 RepID=A0A081KAH8_9GAMM|nr:hypothetical protein GV64_10725 [Endozoicomonas elysicola]
MVFKCGYYFCIIFVLWVYILLMVQIWIYKLLFFAKSSDIFYYEITALFVQFSAHQLPSQI